MKVLIKYFCFFGLIAWSSYLFAGNSKFQVRLELDEKEAKTVPHEIFSYTAPNGRNMDISVAKEIILSVEDVQDASIKLQEDRLKEIPDGFYTVGEDGFKVLTYTEEDKFNLTAEPVIEFSFTENGKKKFADFTKSNIKKSVVVIGDGRILAKVVIMESITGGKIQIFSPTDKINEMAKLVESMGLRLKVKPY